MFLPAWLAFLEFIFPVLPLIISLTVVTALHVVLGEQVPKVAVLRSPERFALFAAPVMDIFGKIFKWFIDLLDSATRLILKIMRIPEESGHQSSLSLAEIREMVNGPESDGVIEQPKREMISAVIDFGEMMVRQVSIPHTAIIAIEADEKLPQVIEMITHHPISKMPVYENDLDHIIGILHLHDLIRYIQRKDETIHARDMMRPVLFVPETLPINQLLYEFRTHRVHMAIVMDEFGGTSGLVTLEDLMDELIGEVADPFDNTPPPHSKTEGWQFSNRWNDLYRGN